MVKSFKLHKLLPKRLKRSVRSLAALLGTSSAALSSRLKEKRPESLAEGVREIEVINHRHRELSTTTDFAQYRESPGWNLEGMVTPEINPYEQELWRYADTYLLPLEQLEIEFPEVYVKVEDLTPNAYSTFLNTYLPNHTAISQAYDYKKKLELFISFHHLRISQKTRILDAAGGGFSYLGNLEVTERYLQDLEIRDAVRRRVGPGTTYIESNLSEIPLPDASLDAISCHHAFEHFQGSADTDFIMEVQRVLSVGGRAVIVPLFISSNYVEMTNLDTFAAWDSDASSQRIFDPTSTLPGKKSGNYARVYSPASFRHRVLNYIDEARFALQIVEHTLGGAPIPNPATYFKSKVSNFNFPYRALIIERKS